MLKNILKFNPKIKLILADVDETVADVYCKAAPEMIMELNKLLSEGKVLFLISGGGLQSIRERIVDFIEPALRYRVIIAHCMGAEVWGFQNDGNINLKPYYGLYEGHMTNDQKKLWREIIKKTIDKFHLQIFSPQPKDEFKKNSNNNLLAAMLADRGAQITFEFANSINLTEKQKNAAEQELGIKVLKMHNIYDLRFPILEYLKKEYAVNQLPIEPRFGGTFALDSILSGVNKTKAIKHVLEDKNILHNAGIDASKIKEIEEIEIWGDKYVQKKGAPDFDMCLAVSPKVRAIDFRRENTDELPKGYNIQLWNGKNELHGGLLEYLQSRSIKDLKESKGG